MQPQGAVCAYEVQGDRLSSSSILASRQVMYAGRRGPEGTSPTWPYHSSHARQVSSPLPSSSRVHGHVSQAQAQTPVIEDSEVLSTPRIDYTAMNKGDGQCAVCQVSTVRFLGRVSISTIMEGVQSAHFSSPRWKDGNWTTRTLLRRSVLSDIASRRKVRRLELGRALLHRATCFTELGHQHLSSTDFLQHQHLPCISRTSQLHPLGHSRGGQTERQVGDGLRILRSWMPRDQSTPLDKLHRRMR